MRFIDWLNEDDWHISYVGCLFFYNGTLKTCSGSNLQVYNTLLSTTRTVILLHSRSPEFIPCLTEIVCLSINFSRNCTPLFLTSTIYSLITFPKCYLFLSTWKRETERVACAWQPGTSSRSPIREVGTRAVFHCLSTCINTRRNHKPRARDLNRHSKMWCGRPKQLAHLCSTTHPSSSAAVRSASLLCFFFGFVLLRFVF